MRRRFAGPILAALVAVAMLALAGPAAAQSEPEPVLCEGTLSNQVVKGDVYVPYFGSCTLDRVIVKGSVMTDLGVSSLSIVNGSIVKGDVTCTDCGELTLDRAIVKGSLDVSETFGGAKVCQSVVGGTTSFAAVFGVTLGDGTAECRGGAFLGDVTLRVNRSGTTVNGNVFNANVTVDRNVGGTTITRNIVRGNLGCTGNTPAPTASENVVIGTASDQCAAV